MDKMSLFSILTVTIPEVVLNIYFAFLVTGEKTHLYLDDKINVIRLLVAVPLMGACAVLVRAFVPNFLLVALLNIVLYTAITKCVYKFTWYKSFINVLLFVGFLATIETVCVPIFIQVTGSSIDVMYSNDNMRFIFSLLERGVQVFVILSLWNWNKVSLNIREYKEAKPVLLSFIVLLLATELIFSFIFIYNLHSFSSIFRIIFIVAFAAFAVINCALFKLISVLTNAVLKKEMEHAVEYRKETKEYIDAIRHYLDNNQVDKAKELCRGSSSD